MKKVIKFVTGKKEEKQEDSKISQIQSKELNLTKNLEKGKVAEIGNCSDYVVNYFVKDKNSHKTKLHKAAWHGNLEKLKSALKKTEINAVDSRHRTALHFAIVQGHPNIVWFLLENNAKTTIYDYEGRTPLLKAIELGHKECIALLLERGADINEADYTGNTGLHIAVGKGCVDLVATLLKKGADTELSNKAGEYVLHIAVKSENEELLNLLLNNRAGVNPLDRDGRTPLILAAKTGNLILVNSLIEFGAQLMVVDLHGRTAEDYALLAGHKEIVMLLKTLTVEKNKHLEIKKEGNKFKNNSPEESFLKETDYIKTRGKDKLEKSEVKSFFPPQPKKKNIKTGNETEKNQGPESPESHFIPPFCQPPRSWDFIQADKVNRVPKTLELKVPVLNENWESYFIERKKLKLSPKYTLSLDRRKNVKIDNFFARRRLSLNGEEPLKSFEKKNKTIKPDPGAAKSDTWMRFNSAKPSMENLSRIKFTLDDQFYKGGEPLSANNKNSNSNSNPSYFYTDYDEISKRKNISKNTSNKYKEVSGLNCSFLNVIFSEPMNKTEMASTFTQLLKCKTGITENNAKNSITNYSSSTTSSDIKSVPESSLPERNFEKKLETKILQKGKTKEATFSQISENKGKEILEKKTKKERILEINKKINKQLDCYDKALKELAESNHIKKDAEPHKYHSLPSCNIRIRNKNPGSEDIFSDTTLFNRNVLSFPTFDNPTFSSFPSSTNFSLKEEKASLKSPSGEYWENQSIEFSFFGLERQETIKKKDDKSLDFSSEKDPLSWLQESVSKKELRISNKSYDSDEDVSEIPEEESKNKEITPFSPLGVIFKEIQEESENELLNIPISPEFNFHSKNQMNSIVMTQKQDLENKFSTNSKNIFFKSSK